MSTLSNVNISKATGPIAIKLCLKHHWVGRKVALGFVLGHIRTLVSTAIDSCHRFTMGKNKKKIINLVRRNQKAKSLLILCVAVYSGPFL